MASFFLCNITHFMFRGNLFFLRTSITIHCVMIYCLMIHLANVHRRCSHLHAADVAHFLLFHYSFHVHNLLFCLVYCNPHLLSGMLHWPTADQNWLYASLLHASLVLPLQSLVQFLLFFLLEASHCLVQYFLQHSMMWAVWRCPVWFSVHSTFNYLITFNAYCINIMA